MNFILFLLVLITVFVVIGLLCLVGLITIKYEFTKWNYFRKNKKKRRSFGEKMRQREERERNLRDHIDDLLGGDDHDVRGV